MVDEREQFLAMRGAEFVGYPDPDATLGEVFRGDVRPGLLDGEGRPTRRVLVAHLGVGLADLIFGAAILARAEQVGLGRLLPR